MSTNAAVIDRDAWLAERRKGLGASDAAPACGLSKWRTPLELWREKTGESPPSEETMPMRIGKALEPVVLQAFCDERGVKLQDQQRVFRDAALPWRWATVDAITTDGALVEAKTAGSALGWGDDADQVPMDYVLQAQHALAVTGLEIAFIPVLIAGRNFRVYELARDPELIDLLTEREVEFWRGVEARTPPDPVTLAEMSLRWPRNTGAAVHASAEVAADCQMLSAIKAQLKQLDAQADETEARIKAAMKDAAALAGPDGEVIATWKSAKGSTSFDTDAFKAAHPGLWQQFQKQTAGSRRFLLKI